MTRHHILRVVLSLLAASVFRIGTDKLHLETEFFRQQCDSLRIQTLVDGHEKPYAQTSGNNLVDRFVHQSGQLVGGQEFRNLQDLLIFEFLKLLLLHTLVYQLTFLFSTLGSFGLASRFQTLLGFLDTTLDILGRNLSLFRFSLTALFILESGLYTSLLEDSLSLFLFLVLVSSIILFLGLFDFLFLYGQFYLTHNLRTLNFLHSGLDEIHFPLGFFGYRSLFHLRFFFHNGFLFHNRSLLFLLVQQHIQVGFVDDFGLFQFGHYRRNMLRNLLGFGFFLRLGCRDLDFVWLLLLNRCFFHWLFFALLLG